MLIPAFADELKFQTGGATRVVTFSLKARAAITMAGHKGDAATWVDNNGSGDLKRLWHDAFHRDVRQRASDQGRLRQDLEARAP